MHDKSLCQHDILTSTENGQWYCLIKGYGSITYSVPFSVVGGRLYSLPGDLDPTVLLHLVPV